ncbi:MAG: adenylosuccinate synthetase, partial [bacterium]|nr:adenylosuccinate synthetase [bacterium]
LKEKDLAEKQLGTTKRGIGPAYADKARRSGLRVGDLRFFDSFAVRLKSLAMEVEKTFDISIDVEAELKRYQDYAKRLEPMIVDSVHYLNAAYAENKKILVEGANATMLDLDFGTYPYVTSSNCSIGGACTGLGLSPDKLGECVGIVKAYTTRVGSGPFPTELNNDLGQLIRDRGHEYGTTTGRPRRCGWFDAVVVKYAHLINAFTALNITKLDVLDTLDELQIATSYKYQGTVLNSMPANLEVLEQVEVTYETMPGWKQDIRSARSFDDLPASAQRYLKRIEELIRCPVRWVGVGPGREEMVEQ